MGTVNLAKPTVNLSKGATINLSKHSEGLKKVTIGLGWQEGEADSASQTVTRTVTKKAGFFARLFGAKDDVITETYTTSSSSGSTMDLDAWAVRLLDDNKLRSENDLVAYFNKDISDKSIHHHGDDLIGGKEGDCEQIDVTLSKMPSEYKKVLLGVTIYSAKSKHQNFSKVRDAFIRIVNADTNDEMCRYDAVISKDFPDSTSFIFGELVRNKDGEWEFNAIGDGVDYGSILETVRKYLNRM